MAAPVGNQFWKQRSKHGRDKIMADPDTMWAAAQEYFAWCDDNPLIEHDFRGKDATPVEIKKMRAYTWAGLSVFLDVFTLDQYRSDNPAYKDFSSVINRINQTMYSQKFGGAAAGLLNPNIIARDLGLTDKTEQKHVVEQPLFAKTPSQALLDDVPANGEVKIISRPNPKYNSFYKKRFKEAQEITEDLDEPI